MTYRFDPQHLAPMQLKQEPPRVRTIFDSYQRPIRLAFPWVSIGRLPDECVMGAGAEGAAGYMQYVFLFFHNEPWQTLDDAVRVLCLPPSILHVNSVGFCCCGPYATRLYTHLFHILKHPPTMPAEKCPTPAEVFWNTNMEYPGRTIRSALKAWPPMLDIENPQRVLKHPWDGINWLSLDYYLTRVPNQ